MANSFKVVCVCCHQEAGMVYEVEQEQRPGFFSNKVDKPLPTKCPACQGALTRQ